MLWVLFLSLIGSFSLTGSYYALRLLGPSHLNTHSKSFFFFSFFCRCFHKKPADKVIIALLFTRQMLFFCLAASVVALLFSFFPFEEWFASLRGGWRWLLLLLSLMVALLLVDLLPRVIALAQPKRTFALLGPFSSCFSFLFFPLTYILLHFPHSFIKALSMHQWSLSNGQVTQRIMALLQEEEEPKSQPDTSHKKLIESVLRFKDRIVRDVMIPRVSLFALPVHMPIQEAVQLVISEGYSRVPVYKESIDQIVGLLMYKDLLPYFLTHSTEQVSIERFVKPLFYIPETKKVSQLLQEFRARQMHLAVVVDEYGGTEGIITIEDILEEIVGEIADEYDEKESVLYTVEPSGAVIVDARMNIWDLEQQCHIRIAEEGDYETIGGFIYQKVGAIPKKGFRLHLDEFVLEVLSSSDRAVEKIRITPVQPYESS